MTRIEDELRRAAAEVNRQAADVDTDAALARVAGKRRGTRSAAVLLAAAAIVAVVVGAVVLLRNDDQHVVADGPPTAADQTTTTITTSTTSTTTTTTSTTPEQTTSPAGDLVAPTAGFEITFDGVGDVRLGDVVAPDSVDTIGPGDACGYWGPAEPSHDGAEPLGGLVAGADTASPYVTTIMVRNPTYRTASGVGIGTTLASLQRVYGDRLVIDRSDGWENPTGGLLASYQDVAAVRDGDRALTFYLRDEVVETVKLSDADFWGDDEGCA